MAEKILRSCFVYSDYVWDTSTSVTKYLIVSLVYFSDSTWQKSEVIPGTLSVFAMYSRKNIRREPMRYLMIDVLVVEHAKNSWERRFARLSGGFGRMVRSP